MQFSVDFNGSVADTTTMEYWILKKNDISFVACYVIENGELFYFLKKFI